MLPVSSRTIATNHRSFSPSRPMSAPREPAGDPQVVVHDALAAGRDLGSPESWRVQTRAADLRFSVPAGELGSMPGLSIRAREWRDPSARDLLADRRQPLSEVSSPDALEAFVHALIDEERPYLSASDVGRPNNEVYAIQNIRRRRLFDALRRHPTRIPPDQQAIALGVLRRAEERTIVGRRYSMDVGTRAQFWPYTETFLRPLIDLAAQTAPGSAERRVLNNRVRDVLRRKSIFTEHDAIDETDLETTLGAAVVYQPPYTDGPGHRISLASDHLPHRPRYTLLTVAREGLPPDLEAYAGARLFLDGRVLRFDDHGRRANHRCVPGPRTLRAAAVRRRDAGVAFVPASKPRRSAPRPQRNGANRNLRRLGRKRGHQPRPKF